MFAAKVSDAEFISGLQRAGVISGGIEFNAIARSEGIGRLLTATVRFSRDFAREIAGKEDLGVLCISDSPSREKQAHAAVTRLREILDRVAKGEPLPENFQLVEVRS